jgi:flagellar hook-associated protein 1 FlgK
VAADLVQRMQGIDPSLPPGAAGLFTDAGAPFDPLAETGLAQRLEVNALADPAQGGSLWRLRAGLGAAAPAPPGDARLLAALHAGLSQTRPSPGGGFMAGERSFAVLAADLLSGVAGARLAADAETSFAVARTTALSTLEMERGVDTDREMQELLLVEQAFGANARVVQTVDELIQMLLRMGG